MARPVPIIVPGPSGMGGSYKKTTAPNLLELIQGLSQIASLYQGTIGASKQKDADALAIENSLRTLGIGGVEAQTPASPDMEMPSGGVVNAPSPGGERLDLGALGRSSMGPDIAQKAVLAKLGQILTPKKYEATNGMLYDPTNPGDQRPIGPQGKSKGINFDTFVDDDGVSWRVGYDAATGAEVSRVKQGKSRQTFATKPQQSGYVDAENNPYNFDPTTGKYVPAVVEGSGKVMPRKKVLTDERTSNMSNGVTYLGQIDKIEKAYNNALAGPAAGNVNKAAGYVMNNPEFQGLRLNVGTLRTVVYQLSGKQINESEQEWLEKDILPSLTQPNENFKAKMGELKNWMRDKLENEVKTFSTSHIIPKHIDDYLKSSQAVKENAGYSTMSNEEILRQLNGK